MASDEQARKLPKWQRKFIFFILVGRNVGKYTNKASLDLRNRQYLIHGSWISQVWFLDDKRKKVKT